MSEKVRMEDEMALITPPAQSCRSQEIRYHPTAGILPLKFDLDCDMGQKALMAKPASQFSNIWYDPQTEQQDSAVVCGTTPAPPCAGRAPASSPACRLILGVTFVIIKLLLCCTSDICIWLCFFFVCFCQGRGEVWTENKIKSSLQYPKLRVHQLESK